VVLNVIMTHLPSEHASIKPETTRDINHLDIRRQFLTQSDLGKVSRDERSGGPSVSHHRRRYRRWVTNVERFHPSRAYVLILTVMGHTGSRRLPVPESRATGKSLGLAIGSSRPTRCWQPSIVDPFRLCTGDPRTAGLGLADDPVCLKA